MKLRARIRLLEAYAALSSTVALVLIFTGFNEPRHNFQELNVERLNVVDRDGRLRVVIANADRMPDPVVNGITFKTERPPGMIFYNGLGDENGGLIFGASSRSDSYGAYGGLSFDQFKQSQAVAVTYSDHSGLRQAGLTVWDRPEVPIVELMAQRKALAQMPEGHEKSAAQAKLAQSDRSPVRMFAGRDKDNASKVTLYDAMGRARINMVVDAAGQARLDFLDEQGKVAHRVPEH